MGGNIETGEMEMLSKDALELFKQDHHDRVDRLVKEEDRERRHDEGPPIFRKDEIIELRGARFRVARIAKNMLMLRPLKG